MDEQFIVEALPLSRLFKGPQARVLDFLFLNRDFDYSESDICRLSGVPSRTLQRVLPILKEEKLIKKTRKSGNSVMYVADTVSKRGATLLQFVKYSVEANLDTIPDDKITKNKPQSIVLKSLQAT